MTFLESIKSCLLKTFTYKGRTSRSEYWWFSLATIIVFYLLGLAQEFLFLNHTDIDSRNIINHSFSTITTLLSLPILSATTRRLHDVNRSGWWQLLWITIIGIPLIFYWTLKESSGHNNRYGSSETLPAEGKRLSLIVFFIEMLFWAMALIPLISPTKEVFQETLHWVYDEYTDSDSRQPFQAARHLVQDKNNKKVIIELTLVCTEKTLGLVVVTYDNPNQTFGNPDITLPSAILRDGNIIKATGSIEGSKITIPFEPVEHTNQAIGTIAKKDSALLLENKAINLTVATDRGLVHLKIDTDDPSFKKVVQHCPN